MMTCDDGCGFHPVPNATLFQMGRVIFPESQMALLSNEAYFNPSSAFPV